MADCVQSAGYTSSFEVSVCRVAMGTNIWSYIMFVL
jgi:hypothetical protein